MIGSLAVMAASALLQSPSCDALKTLSRPHVTITAVEFVAAGAARPGRGGRGGTAAPLPAHCKLAATLTPSTDSHIEMELWLPTENWNGKFLAVGNGGWAGSISFDAMASGLRRGYATASNDTGHKGASAAFAVGHPEKLVDFAYRAMHEMAVQSKAMIQAFYRRAPAALVLPGLFHRRAPGLDGGAALPGGFRRHHRRRARPQHGAPQRVTGRAAGGHAEKPVAAGSAREEDAACECRACGVRRAGRRQGRDRQRAARLHVRSRDAVVQGGGCPRLPHS